VHSRRPPTRGTSLAAAFYKESRWLLPRSVRFPSISSDSAMRRIIVGVTEATGAVLGVKLRRQLARCSAARAHSVLSKWARATIQPQPGLSSSGVASLAELTAPLRSPDGTACCSLPRLLGSETDLTVCEPRVTQNPQSVRWAGGAVENGRSI
jgi:hypothetical protein